MKIKKRRFIISTGNPNGNAPKAVVCGAINIDLLATADHTLQPDDSTPGVLRRSAGGVGRNIAENLVRLGVDVTLISSVGDDDFGRQIVSHNEKIGMDVSQISVSRDLPTSSYTAVHKPDGNLLHGVSDMRLFENFDYPHRGETSFDLADVIVLDANLPEAVLVEIARNYQSKFITADAVSRVKGLRLLQVLPMLSLLKVNRAEAAAVLGRDQGMGDQEMVEALLELGPAQVLLTLGDDGALLFDNNQLIHAYPDNSAVVSTSGVGDAMFSGVLAAKMRGLSGNEQLQWGAAAADHTLGVHTACAESLSVEVLQNYSWNPE